MSKLRALVVSDSHGDVENMCRAIERTRPDIMLFLGDGWHDAEAAEKRWPGLPVEKVPGNCDYHRTEAPERLLLLGGKRILICHGHTLGVKTGVGQLLRTALERDADAALFGHTHEPFVDIQSGVALLNPGSIGSYYYPTYGVLTIGEGTCLPATYILK